MAVATFAAMNTPCAPLSRKAAVPAIDASSTPAICAVRPKRPAIQITAIDPSAPIQFATPPPDPRERNAKVPELLAKVVLRCLQKDPAARYGSTREILAELKAGRIR